MIIDLGINLLASFLGGVVVILWKQVVIPYYKRYTYKGLDLEGDWYSEGEKPITDGIIKHQTKISIKQIGQRLKGSVEIDSRYPTGNPELFQGKIEGFINLNDVIINYFPKHEKNIGSGSLLLRVYANGEELKGKVVFLNRMNGNIEALNEVLLTRVKK